MPQQFEELKKQIMETMHKKSQEMEHRTRDIEVSVDESRTNNDNNYISLKQAMHKYETTVTRDGEQLKVVWDEINKLKEINVSCGRGAEGGEDISKMVGKLRDQIDRFLNMDLDSKLNQIRVNTDSINKI
jgi:hypothetical protein